MPILVLIHARVMTEQGRVFSDAQSAFQVGSAPCRGRYCGLAFVFWNR